VQKAVKSVQNINEKWDWKAEPLRFDPRRNYLLCEHCWNGLHWSPGFIGANGAKHQKSKLCLGNGCGSCSSCPPQTGIPYCLTNSSTSSNRSATSASVSRW
jgi:hypothetical protein